MIPRIIKRGIWSLTVVATLFCGTNCRSANSSFHREAEAKSMTTGLQSIDKIELLELERNGDLWTGEMKAGKVLEGWEAQQVASLWRAQDYVSDSAICHNPAYAMKFFSGASLVVYATLCWDCDNIEFLEPKLKKYQGFVGGNLNGKRLLAVFRSAFPE